MAHLALNGAKCAKTKAPLPLASGGAAAGAQRQGLPAGRQGGCAVAYVRKGCCSNPPKKIAEDINNDTSRPGILGYGPAKKSLFTSFGKSNQDLLLFIEGTLKEK